MISWKKTLVWLSLVLSCSLYPSLGNSANFCVDEAVDDTDLGDTCNEACDTSGTCSLREAIEQANADDVEDIITFAPSITGALTWTASPPTCSQPVQIIGPGADVLTLSAGGNITRVLLFNASGKSFTVSGLKLADVPSIGITLTLSNGNLTLENVVVTGAGQGMNFNPILAGASLTIVGSTFLDNTSSGGASGGGLRFAGSSLTIRDSTFSGNTATTSTFDEGGGGIAILNDENVTAEISNTTISGNKANANGGGIYISDSCGGCGGLATIVATLTNVTIAENTADLDNAAGGPESGGGLFVALNNAGSSVTLNNVLIANNSIGTTADNPDCSGTVASNGFNLVRDPTGCTGVPTGSDSTGENPLLDALALNAPGATQTHALQAGSPAINAGDNATCPTTDQRGVARQGVCDIGAYEAVVCGDGTVGPGETCESGECCDTTTCQFEAEGTACDDGNPDTSGDECSASGLCLGAGGGGGGGGGCAVALLNGSSPAGYGLFLLSLAAFSLLRRRRG